MGFSQAAAGGIVFFAAMLTGFHVGDAVYDDQDAVAAAWGAYHDDQQVRAATAFTIDNVQRFGQARTEVTLTNVGQTTIAADTMMLLFDGQPQPIVDRVVDGTASNVWAPQGVLVLQTAPATPDGVVAADSHGTKAYWRR